MVLGKLPVPRRPTILITVGQGPTSLAVCSGGVVWTFLLSSILSPLSPSLWETARYRLKYCLKGPLNPKQPTNHLPSTIKLQSYASDTEMPTPTHPPPPPFINLITRVFRWKTWLMIIKHVTTNE